MSVCTTDATATTSVKRAADTSGDCCTKKQKVEGQCIKEMTDCEVAKLAIGLIDNTSLDLEKETEDSIKALCKSSIDCEPHTAAICVYPKWIKLCKEELKGTTVKVATVVNFPEGKSETAAIVEETKSAVADGVDEVDLVIDYNAIKEDKTAGVEKAEKLCQSVKEACGTALLKVIIEAGVLESEELIKAASEASIKGGADMVKTSTGKSTKCTPEMAGFMIHSVADCKVERTVGFKAAGGIRTITDARSFLELGQSIKNFEFLAPSTYRIGASSLLTECRDLLSKKENETPEKPDASSECANKDKVEEPAASETAAGADAEKKETTANDTAAPTDAPAAEGEK